LFETAALQLTNNGTLNPVTVDPAEAGRISEGAATVLAALDKWLSYADLTQPARRRERWARLLDQPLPVDPAGFEAAIGELADHVIPNGLPVGAPGFNGFITTGPTTAPALAQFAAAIASPQRYGVSAFNLLEEVSLRWLAELCGLPAGVQGVYSTGGSTANILALGAARQAAFAARGIDVGRDGLPGDVRAVLYASSESHHSVQRAAAVLGLGRGGVRAVPVDGTQRLDVAALEQLLQADVSAGVLPVAIVANAGTTNTGAVDPINAIAELAGRHGVWLHIDGAYGLPAACVPELAPLFNGSARAESWVVDPHKWLATGVGCGATFVRDGRFLHDTFTQTPASYLAGAGRTDDGIPGREPADSAFEDFGVHYDDLSMELSAPPRGVLVWIVLREIGRRGLQSRIRQHVGFARRLTDIAIQEARLESLINPELSIAAVRYLPAEQQNQAEINQLNSEILTQVWRQTPYFPSSTIVDGNFAIRPAYINPRTTVDHVDGLARALVRIGDELTTGTRVSRP
jgi:aromatic-L-amino-acid decarboxylase